MVKKRKYVEAGIPFKIYARGMMIDAHVIGVCMDEALVEFVYPTLSYSALRIINVYDDPMVKSTRKRKNVTYTDDWGLPSRFPFIENAALNNRAWIGKPRNWNYDETGPILTVQDAYELALKTPHRKYMKRQAYARV